MQNAEIELYKKEIARVKAHLKNLIDKKKELEKAYRTDKQSDKQQKRSSKPKLKRKKERQEALKSFILKTFPDINCEFLIEEMDKVQRE